jgi:hypothetical protein
MEIIAMDDTGRSAKVKPAISPFELPKLQVPAAFREIAEKSAAQAKDACDKGRAASESTADLIEQTYTIAVKGAVDYNLDAKEGPWPLGSAWPAPVGHSQPRARDLPLGISVVPSRTEQEAFDDRAIDEKLKICRGC